KRSARTKGIIKSILPVVLVAVVMFAILTYYGISCMIYQSRVLTEQEYLASPLIAQNAEEYNGYANENAKLTAELNYLEGVKRAKYTYPLGNSEVLKKLYNTTKGYADVTISAFSAPEGVLTMSLSAKNVDDINRLIGKLMQVPIFGNVSYAGYTYNEDSQAWTVNVSCVLAESAGREEAEWN
ncbi:MAG: hypothetical protein PUD20_09095, partial [bacterium]|nr:hypothetical protein [bacterium]